MSWIEKVENEIQITTGDGKIYTPQYIDAEYLQDFNLSSFNFRGVKGSLVKRQEPQGRKFGLKIFFQGDSHLDVAESFRLSSYDKRFWTISHPYYGQIFVQPRSLRFNNKKHNLTEITVAVFLKIRSAFD